MAERFMASTLYGDLGSTTAAMKATHTGGAAPPQREGDGINPHDKTDRGPESFWEDPVVWVVLIAAVASGIIGFRFHWSRSGASASVDLGDNIAMWSAVPLVSIAGILVFKVVASKVEIPGLQKVAAAI